MGGTVSSKVRPATRNGAAAKKWLDLFPYAPTTYNNHSYSDTAYRSYVSTSFHAFTTQIYRESIMPAVYDDKNGHFIVHQGDDLTSRYKIVCLLGQGTFGKVIKCWDRVNDCHVAIKVIRAMQKYRDASKIEMRILNYIEQNDPHNINRCIHLRDCFDFRNHICMVFDLFGSSLFNFLKSSDFYPFPIHQIQHIVCQLFASVDFIHRLQLVHTDLKPENILETDNHKITSPKRQGRKEVRESYVTDIRLIDFGSATFENEYHPSVVSTRYYRAPEVILGLGWSYPCDLWSIGCILVELFTGEALFQTHKNLEHLTMMEQVLGKIPYHLVLRTSRCIQAKYFKNGRLNYPNLGTSRQSRKYVREMATLKGILNPHVNFYNLVMGLLDYDPATRYTARQALKHPFLQATFDSEERDLRYLKF